MDYEPSCALCVADREMSPTRWNTAVTMYEGTAYCRKHLHKLLYGEAEDDD